MIATTSLKSPSPRMSENRTGCSSNFMIVTAAIISEEQKIEQTNKIWKISKLKLKYLLLPSSSLASKSYA
jgi:hypothetical protein